MLVKVLIFILYAYFAWWLYFERLKFGDLTLIRQIHQSFQSSSFWFYGTPCVCVPGTIIWTTQDIATKLGIYGNVSG